MWQRIFSIMMKEFIQLSRDRRSIGMVVILPIVQMAIFGYALSTDIKNVSLVVWDASKTVESRELIESFAQTQFFTVNYYAESYDQITGHIESGDAKAALVIPSEYARKLHRAETASVQFFTDGSDPSVGIQALANASLITQAWGAELISEARSGEQFRMPLSLESRIWYNPAMQTSIFYLPGIIGLLLQNLTVVLTALAIVREKENGTIEQLNVTPLRRGELITGKLLPYVVFAYAQVSLIIGTAIVVFDMPMRGNLLLLLVLSSVFLMFSLGIGLLISTVSQNQFQAFQASAMVLAPSILLSGFVWPVETMPRFAQWLSALLPLTYYLRILRGIVVKGIGMEHLWMETGILAAMGIAVLILAASRLRKTLS